MMRDWVSAFRLRTLPLALASVAMGTFLAVDAGFWDGAVFFWCCLTTALLQVLSNLANDYGDSVHGADHAGRVGPARAVQSGKISREAMRKAVWICAAMAFASGVITLFVAFRDEWLFIGSWLVVGLVCIGAAITYTAGRKPYGYLGLGDLSVVLFFGLVAVPGTYFLFARSVDMHLFLPAISCGFLAAGVLNINNIRDMESDLSAGKYSLPVRFGRPFAVAYQSFLLWASLICLVGFLWLTGHRSFWLLLVLIPTPFLWKIGEAVSRLPSVELDPWLRKMALTALLQTLLFGAALLLG